MPMRLTGFRIRNFRSINDTGLVPVGDAMAIIGENESGKTTILKALERFNTDVSYDEDFDPPSNLNIRGTDISDDFLELEFSLSEEDKKWLVNQVPEPKTPTFNVQTEDETVAKESIEEIQKKGLAEKKQQEEHKEKLAKIVKITIKKNREGEYETLDPTAGLFDKYGIDFKQFVPRFVYFNETSVLDDFISIEKFTNQPEEYENVAELFEFCELNIETIDQWNLEPKDDDEVRRRKITRRRKLCAAAAKRLTHEIQHLWSQNTHTFSISADGDALVIQTYDEKNPTPIDLRMKSKGIRWYVSFVIKFDVQTKQSLKNAILLFDEPSDALHPQAQMDFIDSTVCGRLINSNQVIYATHSPFLLGEDERVKVLCVERNDQGISEIVKTSEVQRKNTLLPLRALFGYDSLAHILDEDNILIVEGWNDKKFIQAFSHLSSINGGEVLDPSIYMIQLNGTGKIGKFISIFQDKANSIIALLDSDASGNQSRKIIKEEMPASTIIQTDTLVGNETGQGSEIEDLIPRQMYLAKLKELYPGSSINIEDIRIEGPVCDAISAYFKKSGFQVEFDKQLVNKALLKDIYTSNDKELIASCIRVIQDINNKL